MSSEASTKKPKNQRTKKQNQNQNIQHSAREQQLTNTIRQLRMANQLHKRQDQAMTSAIRRFKKQPIVANAADAGTVSETLVPAAATEVPTSTLVPAEPIVPTSQAPMVPVRSSLSYQESPYLRSLLVPEDGPVDIPDDVNRLHTIRSEPVSANIIVPDAQSGSGILFIYPNHPTSLIGYQYSGVGTPLTNYTYGSRLITAQDLSENYDYGRKTSQIVYARSSTLPSGMYAINGTINAVRVDGTISEISALASPATFYSTILAATANPYDKVMGVSVGDGIAALSIPDSFVIPYTRLNDSSPSSISNGTISISEITDNSEDLTYRIQGQYTFDVPEEADPPVFASSNEIDLNFDSTLGAQFCATLKITDGAASGAVCVQYSIVWLDPFGGLIATSTITNNFSLNSLGEAAQTSELFFLPGQPDTNITNSGNDAPIAQVQITIGVFGSTAMPDVSFGYDISVTAPLGARPGVNMPVFVVAYQNMAVGSTLSITGVTNFELIPNPQTRQIVPIDYGIYDPHEMTQVQSVVMNRTKLNIRSLWNATEYAKNKPAFRSLTTPSLAGGTRTAHALGWSDVVNFMRNKVIPVATRVVGAVAPQFKPVADAISALNGRAASGMLISRAADNDHNRDQDPAVQAFRHHIAPLLRKYGVTRDSLDIETDLMLRFYRTPILQLPLVHQWLANRIVQSGSQERANKVVRDFLQKEYHTLTEFLEDPTVLKTLLRNPDNFPLESQSFRDSNETVRQRFEGNPLFQDIATMLLVLPMTTVIEKQIIELANFLYLTIAGFDYRSVRAGIEDLDYTRKSYTGRFLDSESVPLPVIDVQHFDARNPPVLVPLETEHFHGSPYYDKVFENKKQIQKEEEEKEKKKAQDQLDVELQELPPRAKEGVLRALQYIQENWDEIIESDSESEDEDDLSGMRIRDRDHVEKVNNKPEDSASKGKVFIFPIGSTKIPDAPLPKRVRELKAEAMSRSTRTKLVTAETRNFKRLLKFPRRKPIPPVRSGPKKPSNRVDDYIMFPTLVDDVKGTVLLGQMYLVTNDRPDLRVLLHDPTASTPFVNGKRIYGVRRDDIFLNSPANDLIVLPCDAKGNLQKNAPIVSGHSMGGAVWAFINSPTHDGTVPITGEVQLLNGKPTLLPNPVYRTKALFCHERGVQLIAANEEADIRIVNMNEYAGTAFVLKAFGDPHLAK